MNRVYSFLFILSFCFVAVEQSALVAADAGFNRAQCYLKVTEILQSNNNSITLDPSTFISVSDPTNPVLTLQGCRQLCGSGTGWYADSSPRLVTWLLPLILLVSNMQFAPIGAQRFLMILHLLGDPIDATWSILAKVDSWARCFSYAQSLLKEKIEMKSLAVILAAAEGVTHSRDLALNLRTMNNKAPMIEAAQSLSEMKRNEILRTALAVALYVFSVLAAFVPAVGEASSPSGGRIGSAMLLSWLLPVVLLSNATGDFGSPRNCRRIIAELVKHHGRQTNQDLYPPRTSSLTSSLFDLQVKIQSPYEASMAWSGAMSCYRPGKQFFHASGWKLAFISILPVAIAFGTAFAVLDTAPSYFSCRHILVIAVFSVWLLSAILTSYLSWTSIATGKYLWYTILIKDTVIGCPVLALIIAACCGLGNTCYCWSGALVHGETGALAPLNPTNVFNQNNNVIYPATVAACLTFQVCVFGVMLWIGWPGFRVLWWSEGEMRTASNWTHDAGVASSATQTDISQPLYPEAADNTNIELPP